MTIFKCIVTLTKMTFVKNELKILKSFIEEFNTDSSTIKNFTCLRKNKIFTFKCNIVNNSQVTTESYSEFVEFRNVDKKLQITYNDGKNMIIEEPKEQLKILLKLLVTIDSNNLFKKLKDELTIEDCIELSKGVRSVFSNKEKKKEKTKKENKEENIPTETKTLHIEPIIVEQNISVNFNVEYDKNLADVYAMLQEVIGNISFKKCKSIAKVIRSCINFCVQILQQKGICNQDLENKIIQIYKEKGLLNYKSRPKWNGYTVFAEEVRKNNKQTLPSEIGILWSNISVTEKEKYKNIADIRNKQ